MIDEQDKRALKGSLSNYLQAIAGKSQGGKYNCPICGSGTGKHHTSALVSHRTAKAGSAFLAMPGAMYSSWQRW